MGLGGEGRGDVGDRAGAQGDSVARDIRTHRYVWG